MPWWKTNTMNLAATGSVLLGLGLVVAVPVCGIWRALPTEEQAVESVNQKNIYKPIVELQYLRSTLLNKKPSNELIDTKAWHPGGEPNQWRELLAAGESCDLNRLSQVQVPPSAKKWKRWFEAECKGETLGESFFSAPPFITPLGGSYVFWHLLYSRKNFDKKQFLARSSNYLHLIEHWQPEVVEHLAPPILPGEVDLAPSTIEALVRGEFITVTPKSILFFLSNYDGFQVTPKAVVETEMAQQGYQFTYSAECVSYFHKPKPCLRPLSLYQFNRNALAILGVGSLLVLFGLFFLGRQLHRLRVSQTRTREILLHTLSHEMRHPASSLRLSLEVLRDRFDELPSPAQQEFLRMSTQLQRMNRLMKLADAGRDISERNTTEHSVVDLIHSAVEPYADRVTLTQLDPAIIQADAEWFTLCLQNLLKNSLIHGRGPVEISATAVGEAVTVAVADQGDKPELSFEDMIRPLTKGGKSSGMGLGLTVVNAMVEQMNGRFKFQEKPKQFQMIFKNMSLQKRKASS